jgi:hypothetical protein
MRRAHGLKRQPVSADRVPRFCMAGNLATLRPLRGGPCHAPASRRLEVPSGAGRTRNCAPAQGRRDTPPLRLKPQWAAAEAASFSQRQPVTAGSGCPRIIVVVVAEADSRVNRFQLSLPSAAHSCGQVDCSSVSAGASCSESPSYRFFPSKELDAFRERDFYPPPMAAARCDSRRCVARCDAFSLSTRFEAPSTVSAPLARSCELENSRVISVLPMQSGGCHAGARTDPTTR